MPRQKAREYGICPVCKARKALMSDRRMIRHWGALIGESYADGVCKGWGAKPMPGTEEQV